MNQPEIIIINWTKTALLLFMSILVIGCSNRSEVQGIWEYKVKTPQVDVTGTINILQDRDEYSGYVTMFADTFDLSIIELVDNHLEMENEGAKFSMDLKGDSLFGEVFTADQQFPITAKRISSKFKPRSQNTLAADEIPVNYIPKLKPVPLIFDSDFGPDYDDVGALAILHAMADRQEVDILATIASTSYPNVAPVLNAYNTYFLRPDIPIAIPSSNGLDMGDPQHWSDTILANYPHKIISNSQVESATELYRKILASKPDSSVTIVTVGFLTNMANLLKSGPDQYSDLNGQELVKKKVAELVSMAGWFPEGREFNVFKDAESSKYTFENWPTNIVFSGFEIGSRVLTGIPLINNNELSSSPVKDAYSISIPLDPMDKNGRMSWDQTAVLFAVRGPKPFFYLKEGRITIEEDGSNEWDDSGKGHYHMVFDLPFTEVQTEINELMMHVPVEPEDFDSEKKSIPTIIYDGDIGPDPCDYTTIAILLNYHKKGMINLIGMVGTTPDDYLVPVFDIFNSLYETNIPIASYKNDPEDEIFNNKVRKEYNVAVQRDCKQVNKNKLIYEKFGKPTTKQPKDVLSSVDFYRKTLSEAENGSVIIYIAGQLFNFPALFDSKPDQYSSLSGLELVQKKVKQFVFMGGYFPKSPFNEWNWWGFGYANLTKNTIEALREIKMPILYVGFEQGIKLKIGTQLGEGPNGINASHPIVEGYRYFVASPEKPVSDEGKILYDNPAFDELPVYYLAEGIFEYLPCFSKVEGRAIIKPEGGNEWQNEQKTNEFYLVVNSGCEDQLRKLISDRVKGEFPAIMR